MDAADLKTMVQDRAKALIAAHPGLKLDVSSRIKDTEAGPAGYITVHSIIVPPDEQGQGTGTKVMKSIIELADEHGLQIGVTPHMSYGAKSMKKLTSFYTGLGFASNTGRKRDFDIMEDLRRDPQPVTPVLEPMDAEAPAHTELDADAVEIPGH